jgi:hypothetical protein
VAARYQPLFGRQKLLYEIAKALSAVVDSLSTWMAAGAETLKADPSFAGLWLRAWPAAVDVTNKRVAPPKDDIAQLPRDPDGKKLREVNGPRRRLPFSSFSTSPSAARSALSVLLIRTMPWWRYEMLTPS